MHPLLAIMLILGYAAALFLGQEVWFMWRRIRRFRPHHGTWPNVRKGDD